MNCECCDNPIEDGEEAILQLGTADGAVKMKICADCERFLETAIGAMKDIDIDNDKFAE